MMMVRKETTSERWELRNKEIEDKKEAEERKAVFEEGDF
jgi:hypothetical protein